MKYIILKIVVQICQLYVLCIESYELYNMSSASKELIIMNKLLIKRNLLNEIRLTSKKNLRSKYQIGSSKTLHHQSILFLAFLQMFPIQNSGLDCLL